MNHQQKQKIRASLKEGEDFVSPVDTLKLANLIAFCNDNLPRSARLPVLRAWLLLLLHPDQKIDYLKFCLNDFKLSRPAKKAVLQAINTLLDSGLAWVRPNSRIIIDKKTSLSPEGQVWINDNEIINKTTLVSHKLIKEMFKSRSVTQSFCWLARSARMMWNGLSRLKQRNAALALGCSRATTSRSTVHAKEKLLITPVINTEIKYKNLTVEQSNHVANNKYGDLYAISGFLIRWKEGSGWCKQVMHLMNRIYIPVLRKGWKSLQAASAGPPAW